MSVCTNLSPRSQGLITEVMQCKLQPINFAKKKKTKRDKYTSPCEGLEQGYGGLVWVSHAMIVSICCMNLSVHM